MTGVLVPITAATAELILTEAFAEDPVFVFFTGVPASDAQTPIRRHILRFITRLHALSGHSIWGWRVDGQIVGCALVEDHCSRTRQGLALLRSLPAALGLRFQVLSRLNTYAARSKRACPVGVSHFLVLLGLCDQARGKGLGASFLKALHAEYGPRAHWALDTENPANLTFYEKLDYRLYAQEALGSVTMNKFHRLPQTGIFDENQS